MKSNENGNSILNEPSDPYLVNVRAHAKIRSWARNAVIDQCLNKKGEKADAEFVSQAEVQRLLDCPLCINEDMRDQIASDNAFCDDQLKLAFNSLTEIIIQILSELLVNGVPIERTNIKPIKAKFLKYNPEVIASGDFNTSMIEALTTMIELRYAIEAGN